MNYNEKRKELERVGRDYEEFVVKVMLEQRSTKLEIFRTIEEQYYIGESRQGYEIKLDRNFQRTGNLFIETGEKVPWKDEYTNSGILRNDNTIYYLIGDKREIFILSKRQLRAFHNDSTLLKNYNTFEGETSRGYLLKLSHPLTQLLIIDHIIPNATDEFGESYL